MKRAKGIAPISRLTRAQLIARAEAYAEAAGHLHLEWTDDPVERREGNRLAIRLEREAVKWTKAASRRPL